MQVTYDMNKCPEKYVCMDQSNNKGIYKVKCQKGYSMFIKTMNIEVLGIFQCEYHPRCCNYCTSVMFSLLGLITLSTSLTNRHK